MVKKAKSKKPKRSKGKSLSQSLRDKEKAREELDRKLAEELAAADAYEDDEYASEEADADDSDEYASDADDADEYADDADEYADDADADADEYADDASGADAAAPVDDASEEDDDALDGLQDLLDQAALGNLDDDDEDDEEYDDDDEEAAALMGHQRYVMAGFFALWMVVSYVLGRALEMLWSEVASRDWFVENLPQLAAVPHEGELISRESLSLVLGALIAALVVLRYYFKPDIRTWADEVAEEMAHVKWPNRKETGNHTVVVIISSAVITFYLWLLDQFWTFATNLIYQSGA